MLPTHTIEAFAVYCRSHWLFIYGLIVLFTVRAAKQVWDILPPYRDAFFFAFRLSLWNFHFFLDFLLWLCYFVHQMCQIRSNPGTDAFTFTDGRKNETSNRLLIDQPQPTMISIHFRCNVIRSFSSPIEKKCVTRPVNDRAPMHLFREVAKIRPARACRRSDANQDDTANKERAPTTTANGLLMKSVLNDLLLVSIMSSIVSTDRLNLSRENIGKYRRICKSIY